MHGLCKPASGRALLGLLVAAVLLASLRLAAAQTGRHDVTFEGENYGAAGPPMAPRPSGLAGGFPLPFRDKGRAARVLAGHARARTATHTVFYVQVGKYILNNSTSLYPNITSSLWWGNSTAAEVSSHASVVVSAPGLARQSACPAPISPCCAQTSRG